MLRQPFSNQEKENNKYFDNEFPLESSHHVQNLSPPKTYAFRNLGLEGVFRYHPIGHLHWRARDGNVPFLAFLYMEGGLSGKLLISADTPNKGGNQRTAAHRSDASSLPQPHRVVLCGNDNLG